MPKASKEAPEVAPVPQTSPVLVAAAQRQAQQVADAVGRAGNTVIGPGGIRREGSKYLGVRVQVGNKTDLLAQPEKIIRPDRRKRGGAYCWAKRDNSQTSAFISCGWYQPVEFEDIDRVPGATVQMVEMPGGPRPEDGLRRYVVDGGLLLVWMPQEVHDSIYRRAEEQAWGAQAEMNISFAQRIEAALGNQGTVTIDGSKDARTETVHVAAPQPQAAAS